MFHVEQSEPVEKGRQQGSPHFAVLTYNMYAPRPKMTAAFPSAKLRAGLDELF